MRSAPGGADHLHVSGRPADIADSTVSFIVVARHNGMSYERIADLLNRLGVASPRGARWWPASVRRVAHRHAPPAWRAAHRARAQRRVA